MKSTRETKQAAFKLIIDYSPLIIIKKGGKKEAKIPCNAHQMLAPTQTMKQCKNRPICHGL